MFEISVIIPCYNCAKYLERCLSSVINQNIGLDKLQIICVDDASTDDTLSHLQMWERKYPDNILVIHCEHNGRRGTACNIGMQYVQTPYVSFVDSDDWIDPDYYRIMYSSASEHNCDVVCCTYERDYSTVPSTQDHVLTEDNTVFILVDSTEKRKMLICERWMQYSSWGKLIKTDFLQKYNIVFPELLFYEENPWGSLLHAYAERIFIIEEKMYHYFVNENSIVMSSNADYHVDYITTFMQLWKEWDKRGLLDLYYNELELDFLYSFYYSFLRILMIRYSSPSYSLFQLLKQITLDHAPNCLNNPYIPDHFNEFEQLIISSLGSTMDKNEFNQFAQQTRVYWGLSTSKE